MAIKAVIDTNICVSAILNPHGYPARLRALFENLVTRDNDIKHDETVISFLGKYGVRVTTIDLFLQYLGA